MFEEKYKYDFSVAIYYLNVNYWFWLLELKIYRPNLLINDSIIDHYQKVHRDYEDEFSDNDHQNEDKCQEQEIQSRIKWQSDPKIHHWIIIN